MTEHAGSRQKVAVIGGGVIGGGWAARFALHGWDVAVFDPHPDAAERIADVLDNARLSLPALADFPMPAEGDISMVADLASAVSGATWVQESVPEDLALKHAVLAEIQPLLSDDAVVGSSTSGF